MTSRLSPRDTELLDNLPWFALTSRHRHLAEGTGAARRYQPEVAGFVGIKSTRPEAWADLAAVSGTGEEVAVFGALAADAPDGWTRLGGGAGRQMILLDDARLAEADDRITPLDRSHVPQMLALVELTKPGPFRPRTIEMGSYFGAFDDDGRLIALAGERLGVAGFTEISAVCTHPDARGAGWGGRLTSHVARHIAARGETPILHVAETNVNAQRVYDRLGFTLRSVVQFTLLQTPSQASALAS